MLFVSVSGTPSGVKYGEVRERLYAVKGVKAVHNLHIWALTVNQAVLSAHVAIGEKTYEFMKAMKHILLVHRLLNWCNL